MHYEVTVEIEAPPEAVWSLLTDVERWPQWTASMTSVRRLDSGEIHVGSEARVKQPGLLDATWRVTELAPGCNFTWESRSLGVRVVGGHLIKGVDGGRSAVTVTVHQTGPIMALARPFVEGLTCRYLAIESAGLKRRCEGKTP